LNVALGCGGTPARPQTAGVARSTPAAALRRQGGGCRKARWGLPEGKVGVAGDRFWEQSGTLEEEAREQFCNLWLCVSDFNFAAQRFYQTHGYALVARLDGFMREATRKLMANGFDRDGGVPPSREAPLTQTRRIADHPGAWA
jgi:hypothetical protein